MNSRTIGIIAGFLSAVGYGAYSVFTNMIMHHEVSNVTILSLRMVLAASVLWICYALGKKDNPASRADLLKLFLIGGCIYASSSACLLYSIRLIPTSLPLVLICTYPVFVALYAVLAGQRRFQWRIPFAFVMALVGLWLAMNIHALQTNMIGVLAGMGAAVFFAAYAVLGSKVDASIHPVERSAALMSGAAFTYLIVGVIKGGLSLELSAGAWGWMACIVILSTVLPVYLFWVCTKKAGVMEASTLGLIEPIANIIFFVIIFGEVLSVSQIIGIVLTIAGVFLIQLPERHGAGS